MSVYSVNKLMQETRRLAADYHKVTGQVLPVSNELGRFDVCDLLNFTQVDNHFSYDCIGSGKWNNNKFQIKSRVVFNNAKSRPKVGQLNFEADWDYTLLVIYNEEYDPQEIYANSKEALIQSLSNPSDDKDEDLALDKEKTQDLRKLKNTISVAKFKAIGDLIWQASAADKSQELKK